MTGEERAKVERLRSAPLAKAALSVCDVFPRGSASAAMFTPLASDVPVLLLSGGLDPVTPPAYAEEVAKTLRNHRHVVAAGYGHIVSPPAGGPGLGAACVDGGRAALPQACIDYFASSTRPPLWSDRMAPAP